MKTSLRFLLLLCLSASLASCATEPVEDPTAIGSLMGVNYTDEAIQYYSIGKSGGTGIDPYGVSGGVCCARYPRRWHPEIKIKVEWKRSDCRRQEQLCTMEAARARTYPFKTFSKTVTIPEYTAPGDVYTVFDPNDEVRVIVSEYGLGPGFLNYPRKPANERKEKP